MDNDISDVSPLAQVSSIRTLDLSENELISDFSGVAANNGTCNLEILKIEDAGITKLPDANTLQAFSKLISINLSNNQITDETTANLAAAPYLEELYLNNNLISDTTKFSEITTLTKLYLDGNQIKDVSGLVPLTRLRELHLNGNQISDIAGLNSLPVLATLDLKNQTLTGTTSNVEEPYVLPTVFSQAKNLSFPKVNGFKSTKNYDVTNGMVNYGEMAAMMMDPSEEMTVTITDGGLSGTKVTVTYIADESGGGGGTTMTFTKSVNENNTTVKQTSTNAFIVTSDKACMALVKTQNNKGEIVWERLASSPVVGNDKAREFTVNQTGEIEVVVAYIGDANGDKDINVRDARRIVNSIIGSVTLSSLEEKLADVDGKAGVNVRDARAIINSIMGAKMDW